MLTLQFMLCNTMNLCLCIKPISLLLNTFFFFLYISFQPQQSSPGHHDSSQVQATKEESRRTTVCGTQDVRITLSGLEKTRHLAMIIHATMKCILCVCRKGGVYFLSTITFHVMTRMLPRQQQESVVLGCIARFCYANEGLALHSSLQPWDI